MGAAPVAGGQKAGGFGESQTDWSKVANPMAFEGYTERPERAMIENLAQDPLWVERQKSQMEQQQKIGIGTAAIEAEAAAQQRGNEKARADVAQLAEGWINQENERRRAAGQPDMLPQDEQQWYAMAQQRYGIAPKL